MQMMTIRRQRAHLRGLVGIFGDDEFNVFSSGRSVVLEIRGSTAERLRNLESAMGVS